jgi:hypothetical protein
MNHKFTLGVVAGLSSIALAIPLLSQISNAASADASTSTVTTTHMKPTRPLPTIQNVQDMITRDTAFLKNADAIVALQKSATQTHLTELTAAASITDDTARQAAVKKANDDERSAIQAGIVANPDMKTSMMPMMRMGGHGGKMQGGAAMQAALATKLGMTEADLKAELATGKTIQQIATEKGITLPTRAAMGAKGGFRGGHMKGNWSGKTTTGATTSSTASVQ